MNHKQIQIDRIKTKLMNREELYHYNNEAYDLASYAVDCVKKADYTFRWEKRTPDFLSLIREDLDCIAIYNSELQLALMQMLESFLTVTREGKIQPLSPYYFKHISNTGILIFMHTQFGMHYGELSQKLNAIEHIVREGITYTKKDDYKTYLKSNPLKEEKPKPVIIEEDFNKPKKEIKVAPPKKEIDAYFSLTAGKSSNLSRALYSQQQELVSQFDKLLTDFWGDRTTVDYYVHCSSDKEISIKPVLAVEDIDTDFSLTISIDKGLDWAMYSCKRELVDQFNILLTEFCCGKPTVNYYVNFGADGEVQVL